MVASVHYRRQRCLRLPLWPTRARMPASWWCSAPLRGARAIFLSVWPLDLGRQPTHCRNYFVGLRAQHPRQPTREVAGLEHLEGCTLAVLADGSPVEGCVVRGAHRAAPCRRPGAGGFALPIGAFTPAHRERPWFRHNADAKPRLRSVHAAPVPAVWAGSMAPAVQSRTTCPLCQSTGQRPCSPSLAILACAPCGGWG